MRAFTLTCRSEQDTDRLGAALAAALPDRATIGLCGTLGAGKTRLVQAVAVANQVRREDVTSPTFVICQHYRGKHAIHHLDAYRVRDEDEWFELGVDELFERPGWTFVEWADRFEDQLPESYLRIDIEVANDTQRLFRLTPIGNDAEVVLQRLEQITSSWNSENAPQSLTE